MIARPVNPQPLRVASARPAAAAASDAFAVDLAFTTLQKRLARLGFSDWTMLPQTVVLAGELWPFAHVIRFVFHQSLFATFHILKTHTWFVVEKEDGPLIDGVLKLLRLEFAYSASLSPVQFKKAQFGGKKVVICSDFIALMARLEHSLAEKTAAAKVVHPYRTTNAMEAEGPNGVQLLLANPSAAAAAAAAAGTGTMPASSRDGRRRCVHRDPTIAAHAAHVADELRMLDLKRKALNHALRQPIDLPPYAPAGAGLNHSSVSHQR